jgi:hypothetical protein
MAGDLIDFEWYRCPDGYTILHRQTRANLMKKNGAKFLLVGGYPYEDDRLLDEAIVSASDRIERYRPLDHFDALFRDFVRFPATPEGMRDFCGKFGLLEGPSLSSNLRACAFAAMMRPMLAQRGMIERAFNLFKSGDPSELVKRLKNNHLARARIELRLEPDGRAKAVIIPEDLIGATWIQFALDADSRVRLHDCEQCGEWFRVGTGTGRRGTAKYCGNACKVAAFKARKGT